MENRRVLYASAGTLLTNGQNVGRKVYLGEQDSPDNWHEITETEAEQLLGLAIEED